MAPCRSAFYARKSRRFRVTPFVDPVPAEPICHVENGDPCTYAGACGERRQKIASGIVRGADGHEVERPDLALTGERCVWFQWFVDRAASSQKGWRPLPGEAA